MSYTRMHDKANFVVYLLGNYGKAIFKCLQGWWKCRLSSIQVLVRKFHLRSRRYIHIVGRKKWIKRHYLNIVVGTIEEIMESVWVCELSCMASWAKSSPQTLDCLLLMTPRATHIHIHCAMHVVINIYRYLCCTEPIIPHEDWFSFVHFLSNLMMCLSKKLWWSIQRICV